MPVHDETTANLVIMFRGRMELDVDRQTDLGTQTRTPAKTEEAVQNKQPLTQANQEEAIRQLVTSLAQNSSTMAHDIEEELHRLLPPGIAVMAEVSVGSGSLVIAGVITFLQWASPAFSAAFVELAKKLTDFAVDRVIERWVRTSGSQVTSVGSVSVRPHGQMRIDTSVQPVLNPVSSVTQVSIPASPRVDERPRWLLRSASWLLMVFNSILLIVIIVLDFLRFPRLP